MRAKSFDLNLLAVAVAIDETRSVSKAARLLDMSQPGVSTALSRLRAQFDDPLFVRTSRGMEATTRGAQLIIEARHVVGIVEQRILTAPVFDPLASQTEFRFAMPDVGEVLFAPVIMKALRQQAPHAVMRTSSYEPSRLGPAMEAGDIDLALGYFPDLKGNSFNKKLMFRHGFECMMRTDHPAAHRLTKEAFMKAEHAVVEAPIRSQELVESYFESHHIARHITIRTTHYLTLPMLVADSDLIATVPRAVAKSYSMPGKIRLVKAPYPLPAFDVCQHWHRRFDLDLRSMWLRELIDSVLGPASPFTI